MSLARVQDRWLRHSVADPATATLLALLRVWERDGRATVRSVAAEHGRGLAATHRSLCELRDLGLVTWEPGTTGTLRPLVREVIR